MDSLVAADSALAIGIFAADELFYDIQPNTGVGIFTLIGGFSLDIVVTCTVEVLLRLAADGLRSAILPCLPHLHCIPQPPSNHPVIRSIEEENVHAEEMRQILLGYLRWYFRLGIVP